LERTVFEEGHVGHIEPGGVVVGRLVEVGSGLVEVGSAVGTGQLVAAVGSRLVAVAVGIGLVVAAVGSRLVVGIGLVVVAVGSRLVVVVAGIELVVGIAVVGIGALVGIVLVDTLELVAGGIGLVGRWERFAVVVVCVEALELRKMAGNVVDTVVHSFEGQLLNQQSKLLFQ
jgi:hypothetical protein